MIASEITCRCGKPPHPNYGNRCEDCWSEDNSPIFSSPIMLSLHQLRGFGESAVALHDPDGPNDRHWCNRTIEG